MPRLIVAICRSSSSSASSLPARSTSDVSTTDSGGNPVSGVFIALTLRGTRPSAVQSATGFFYLAVITAFTAELAAKVRFLP